jgi:hypothetical protein
MRERFFTEAVAEALKEKVNLRKSNELPELAFDHAKIVQDALKLIQ